MKFSFLHSLMCKIQNLAIFGKFFWIYDVAEILKSCSKFSDMKFLLYNWSIRSIFVLYNFFNFIK